jgi:peptidoglycan/LPS O-acetylase OafA/YrhL
VRNASLDVLRAVAVLMVLGQHHFPPGGLWSRIGWAGVDLFFVLSGYLVTGLLIAERQRNGRVNVGRFLVRRAFKIYPAFWVMIAATVAMTGPVETAPLLSELLFIQNYGPALWVHTWSLAVEEHFYLMVAVLFGWLNGRGVLRLGTALFWASVVLVAVFALRCLTLAVVPSHYKLTHWGTHVRIDALVFGAMLAYLCASAGPVVSTWVERHCLTLAAFSVAMLATVALAANHPLFIKTVGYTLTYLAAGGILLTAIHVKTSPGIISWVGRHSYGIYLWHLLIAKLAEEHAPALVANFGMYAATTVTAGVALSRLIEFPALALRDRRLPGTVVA